jgi:hypothetical protein
MGYIFNLLPLKEENQEENATFRRVRKISEREYYLRQVCPSAWNNSAPTRGTSIKFDILGLRKSVMKIPVSLNSVKNNGYFT